MTSRNERPLPDWEKGFPSNDGPEVEAFGPAPLTRSGDDQGFPLSHACTRDLVRSSPSAGRGGLACRLCHRHLDQPVRGQRLHQQLLAPQHRVHPGHQAAPEGVPRDVRRPGPGGLQTSGSGGVANPAVKERIDAMLRQVERLPHVTQWCRPTSGVTTQISANGHIAFATVTFDKQSQNISTEAAKAWSRRPDPPTGQAGRGGVRPAGRGGEPARPSGAPGWASLAGRRAAARVRLALRHGPAPRLGPGVARAPPWA